MQKPKEVFSMNEVLTVSDLQEVLKVSRCTAYRLVWSGRVPSIRLGKTIRIPRAALERLLETAQSQKGGKEA
jgi:excisionase family DNA binding protein